MLARRTAAVVFGGLLAAGVVSGPVAAASPSSQPGRTVVVDCLGKKVAKPKQLVLTCADAGVVVQDIRWTSWTANRATGIGTLAWNTCLPTDCASGAVETYRARVVLSRVASGPAVTAFSKLTLAFPQGGPALAETATYTLDNRLAS